MKTPSEVADILQQHMSQDQAEDIATEIYQPLLRRINELQRRLDEQVK